MQGTLFAFMASGFASLANLFFRKNTELKSAGANGYLLYFNLFCFFFSLSFFPQIWESKLNPTVLVLGSLVGILTVLMMQISFRALKQGPSGLTFAFINASALFPGFLLFLFFGETFGYAFSYMQMIGLSLVLIGLFWGTKNETSTTPQSKKKWLMYTLLCFGVQILALTLFQGRCIFFDAEKLGIFASCAVKPSEDMWFLPAQFGASYLIQLTICIKEKTRISKYEALYSFLGSLTTFGSTALLLIATKSAHPYEQALIFPVQAVGALILCNLWAYKLYKEQFNLISNFLCALGIFLGFV